MGPVSVHAWYGSSSKVIIAIWKMARDQHMFYRSKRTTRVSVVMLYCWLRISNVEMTYTVFLNQNPCVGVGKDRYVQKVLAWYT